MGPPPPLRVICVREKKSDCAYLWNCVCGCKKIYSCVCVCARTRVCTMHVCVFKSILILPAKIILQPSLISSRLCKQRKRRLVTPPPLLFLLSLYPLLHKRVSAHVCKRDVCRCVIVWGRTPRFGLKIRRKGKRKAIRREPNCSSMAHFLQGWLSRATFSVENGARIPIPSI